MKYVLVAAVIWLVFFGGSKLSDVGKGLGEGIKNFKDVFKNGDDTASKSESETEKKA